MLNLEKVGLGLSKSQRSRGSPPMDSDSSSKSRRTAGGRGEKQSGRLPSNIRTQPMLYSNAGYFSDNQVPAGDKQGSHGFGGPFRRSFDFFRRSDSASRRRSEEQQQQQQQQQRRSAELQRRVAEAPRSETESPRRHVEPTQQRAGSGSPQRAGSGSPQRGGETTRPISEHPVRVRHESPLKGSPDQPGAVAAPGQLVEKFEAQAKCEQNARLFMHNARSISTLIFPVDFFPLPCRWDQLVAKLALVKRLVDRDLEVVRRLQAIASGKNIDRSPILGKIAKSSESARRLEEVSKAIQSRRHLMGQSLANIERWKRFIQHDNVIETDDHVRLRTRQDPGQRNGEILTANLPDDPTGLRGLRLLIYELGQLGAIGPSNSPAMAPQDLYSWQAVLDDLTLRMTQAESTNSHREDLLRDTVRMRAWITSARKHVLRTMDHGQAASTAKGQDSPAERLLRLPV